LCGRWFDSKAEAEYGESLRMREMAGDITGLTYQRKFILSEEPKATITIDFCYTYKFAVVFEDVKGVMTRDFRTKLAWLKQKYGEDVRIVS
jgi:hypothetical protein